MGCFVPCWKGYNTASCLTEIDPWEICETLCVVQTDPANTGRRQNIHHAWNHTRYFNVVVNTEQLSFVRLMRTSPLILYVCK